MKKKLKIVLKKDVENLGFFGDVKEVAAGYARNYLVPKGLALFLKDPACKEILKQTEAKKEQREKEIEELDKISQKLKGISLVIKARVGEKGKLYGAIGPKEIVAKLAKEYKIKLDKKQFEMEPIKEIGEREVVLNLGHGIKENFGIKIEPEEKPKKSKKAKKKNKPSSIEV